VLDEDERSFAVPMQSCRRSRWAGICPAGPGRSCISGRWRHRALQLLILVSRDDLPDVDPAHAQGWLPGDESLVARLLSLFSAGIALDSMLCERRPLRSRDRR